MKHRDSAHTERIRLDHPLVSRGVRIYWTLLSIAIVGYGLYGVIINDLLIPGGRYSNEPGHLHAPASFVALAAAICFSAAIRAVILDRFVRFRHGNSYRVRVRTFGLIILSFATFLAAMFMQVQSDVAVLLDQSGALTPVPSATSISYTSTEPKFVAAQSKCNLTTLDFVFTSPAFRNNKVTSHSGIPSTTAA